MGDAGGLRRAQNGRRHGSCFSLRGMRATTAV
jgi:hypothetical protein